MRSPVSWVSDKNTYCLAHRIMPNASKIEKCPQSFDLIPDECLLSIYRKLFTLLQTKSEINRCIAAIFWVRRTTTHYPEKQEFTSDIHGCRRDSGDAEVCFQN